MRGAVAPAAVRTQRCVASAGSPLPIAQDHEDATPQRSRRGLDSRSFIAGLCIALTINGGGLLALWWTVRHPETKTTKVAEVYVDAKLVKFGKKRDMSWLPHVPVSPKTVENHVRNILSKLHLSKRQELIRYALEHGIE